MLNKLLIPRKQIWEPAEVYAKDKYFPEHNYLLSGDILLLIDLGHPNHQAGNCSMGSCLPILPRNNRCSAKIGV